MSYKGASRGLLRFPINSPYRTHFWIAGFGHETELFSRYRFALHRPLSETERGESGGFGRRCFRLRRRRQFSWNRHRSREPKTGFTRTRHKPHSAESESLAFPSALNFSLATAKTRRRVTLYVLFLSTNSSVKVRGSNGALRSQLSTINRFSAAQPLSKVRHRAR